MIAWSAVMSITALLLLIFAAMAKRTSLAGWAAIPIVMTGCVIAFDLGQLGDELLSRAERSGKSPCQATLAAPIEGCHTSYPMGSNYSTA
jgi:hypothetical protein